MIIGIRPSHFDDAAHGDGSRRDGSWARFPVTVTATAELGTQTHAIFPVDAPPIDHAWFAGAAARNAEEDEAVSALAGGKSLWTARVSARCAPRPGQPLELVVNTGKLHFFDPATGQSIGHLSARHEFAVSPLSACVSLDPVTASWDRVGPAGGAAMADHLEIEQKFDVDPDFERPDFAAVTAGVAAAAPVLHRLSATYFDTADGRLQAAKITLRRRTGGTDAGWHLKLPAGAGLPGGVSARREVHEPLERRWPTARVRRRPGRLASRVAEVTGGLPLAPIAILVTERTVVTLTSADGTLLAEVADDQVTARRLPGDGGRAAALARDRGGGARRRPELQRAAADRLLAAGARPAGHGSKLARLLERMTERIEQRVQRESISQFTRCPSLVLPSS